MGAGRPAAGRRSRPRPGGPRTRRGPSSTRCSPCRIRSRCHQRGTRSSGRTRRGRASHEARRGRGRLQIDVGSGDPLAVPARRIEIARISLLAVRPETMFGWKVHGLVEMGHGQWKKGPLRPLSLDRHCVLEDEAIVRSIALAFSSQGYALTLLDRFLYSDQWGAAVAAGASGRRSRRSGRAAKARGISRGHRART